MLVGWRRQTSGQPVRRAIHQWERKGYMVCTEDWIERRVRRTNVMGIQGNCKNICTWLFFLQRPTGSRQIIIRWDGILDYLAWTPLKLVHQKMFICILGYFKQIMFPWKSLFHESFRVFFSLWVWNNFLNWWDIATQVWSVHFITIIYTYITLKPLQLVRSKKNILSYCNKKYHTLKGRSNNLNYVLRF